MDLRNYVLVDLDSGVVIRDPRRVRLVHEENLPEIFFFADAMTRIAVADNDGIDLADVLDLDQD